ncbi:MAG: hypothetical protein BJ554DRAFT_5047 [Olpidium bornovanus]|uniref:Uncharacterized protein n=1 Tax=Olpidium bornovanus TaxID=278681 RepID=A0A8H7ZLJ2_9FUNG|nr:MAG: hypothetical protein BJ554DRAFT_5047 [Olpidium bornovanus]
MRFVHLGVQPDVVTRVRWTSGAFCLLNCMPTDSATNAIISTRSQGPHTLAGLPTNVTGFCIRAYVTARGFAQVIADAEYPLSGVILFTSLLVFLVVVVLSGYMMKLLFYFFPSWFTHSTLDMADKLHGEGLGAFPADDVVDEDLDEYWELVQLLHSASSSLSSFSVDALHMALGFVLVGMLGFLQIMLAIFAHGGGIFWNGAGGRDREGLGIGILVAVIVVGGLRALWDIYKLVRWFARSGLERLEEVILEVHN